jgi:hypothetical protein
MKPTGPIDTTLCDYETVESVNDKLFANLHELVQMPFFKYFQVSPLVGGRQFDAYVSRSTFTESARFGLTMGRATTQGAQ